MTTWHRIDDPEHPAPKDGTLVDLWTTRGGRRIDCRWTDVTERVVHVRARKQRFEWVDGRNLMVGSATHWRLSPEPPRP